MDKEKIQKFIDLLTAYKEGKTIQIECEDPIAGISSWEDIHDLSEIGFDDNPKYFRIKPIPVYVPFENAEEFLEAFRQHGEAIKGNNIIYIPTTITATCIHLSNADDGTRRVTYNNVLGCYRFLDGTRCGKLKNE